MGAMPVPKLTVDEYLALDRASEVPSEYHDGEVFPIEAVTLQHSILGLKVGGWLERHLLNTSCQAAGSPLRVRVSPTKFVIPDLLVYCGTAELTDEHHDTITNPKLIIEILSPSTTDYDYGHKFILYRRLASFEEYLLISQDQPRVEQFRKTSQDKWALSTYKGLDAIVPIESLELRMPLADIYAGLTFSVPADD